LLLQRVAGDFYRIGTLPSSKIGRRKRKGLGIVHFVRKGTEDGGTDIWYCSSEESRENMRKEKDATVGDLWEQKKGWGVMGGTIARI
jgi:CRISPR/Cas system CSM-associated protein Csm3 (group 7 of RAMP superfamily)